MNYYCSYIIFKRIVDIVLSLIGLTIFSIPLLIIGFVLMLTSGGPVIHWSMRIGKGNKIFKMAKLRTMKKDAPVLASNILIHPEKYLIHAGKSLRRFGIDELPQIYNILKGEMTFIGPRPALYNDEIVSLRKEKGISSIKPGLTGLAQICGRNNIPAETKVMFDEYYMKNMSPLLDTKILLFTLLRMPDWGKQTTAFRIWDTKELL